MGDFYEGLNDLISLAFIVAWRDPSPLTPVFRQSSNTVIDQREDDMISGHIKSATLKASCKWVIEELFPGWTPDLRGCNIKDRDNHSLECLSPGCWEKRILIHTLLSIWSSWQQFRISTNCHASCKRVLQKGAFLHAKVFIAFKVSGFLQNQHSPYLLLTLISTTPKLSKPKLLILLTLI